MAVRAGRGAGARDDDLQCLGGVGRDAVLAPDLLDQPALADALVRGRREHGEQGLGALAGHRHAVPADIGEQRQRRIVPALSSAPLDGTGPLGGERDGRVARGRRLLLGQGAVGRPEPQRERERLAAPRPPGRRCRGRRAGSTRAGPPHPRAGPPRRPPSVTAASTTRATSSFASGYVENSGPGVTSRARRIRKSRSTSTAALRGGSPNAWQTLRVQLAGVTELDAVDQRPGRSGPGARAHAVADTTSTSTPSSVPSRRTMPDRVGPAGLATRAPPAGALALAGEDDGEVQRLLRERLEQLGQLGVARTPVDAVDRRRAAVDRERDGAGLEERHPGRHRGRGCAPRP